jgi:hypothetical protein
MAARRHTINLHQEALDSGRSDSNNKGDAMLTLDQVVPWGRSFDEYRRMFALCDADLQLKILGCADGPAGFNAEATRHGHSVISADPLYRYDTETIRDRIAVTHDKMLEQARRNRQQFVWDTIQSVEELGRMRMRSMQTFLDDYNLGKRQGRYVDAELPSMAFPDKSFDLALCSHFLFLYTEHLSESFHHSAILELCRVAREVRIFPLLALDGRVSPYVASVVGHLGDSYEISIRTVPYEFQRGGNQMMRLLPLPIPSQSKPACRSEISRYVGRKATSKALPEKYARSRNETFLQVGDQFHTR